MRSCVLGKRACCHVDGVYCGVALLYTARSVECQCVYDLCPVPHRSLGNGATSAQSSHSSLAGSCVASDPSAPHLGQLGSWQRRRLDGSVSDSTDDDDVSSNGSADSAASRTSSRRSFRFPWAGSNGSSRAPSPASHHGMSVDSAGGDHTADAMPRTPNPVKLSPPLVRHKRFRKARPGSMVVKPSVNIAASKALPAAEGAPPDTMLVHGRPATASSAAATLPAASADLEQRPPAAWHWGPPDPVKAAAWAGARKAVRFASLPADAARGAAQIVSYPVRWVVFQPVLHMRPTC
jgi:hypothetical protein